MGIYIIRKIFSLQMEETLSEKKIEIMDVINPFYIQTLANLKLIEIPGVETKLDLESASHSIDILEFVFKKMENGLDSEEKKVFEEILGILKYQFIQVKNQTKKEEK
uniref:DUF1844 domain-containing protein n=1 Tax=candidate division WOR-3 bacterium TaxID=2052148 RepID=A0A7C3NDB4_UNCW3